MLQTRWAGRAAALAAVVLVAAPAAAEEVPGDGGPEVFELRRGMREWQGAIGYGWRAPLEHFDTRTDARFIQLVPGYGRFQTTRRELVFEAPETVFTSPDPAVAFGPTALLRQHFARRGRVIPYAELGAGFVLTSVDIRELGGPFQFVLQGGAGLRVPLRSDSSLLIGARWYHLSNAGYRSPNTGLNNLMVTVGYTRRFR